MKKIGILLIVPIILSVLLLNVCGVEQTVLGNEVPDHTSFTYRGHKVAIGYTKSQVDAVLGAGDIIDSIPTSGEYTYYTYLDNSIYIGMDNERVMRIEIAKPTDDMRFYIDTSNFSMYDILRDYKLRSDGIQMLFGAEYDIDGNLTNINTDLVGGMLYPDSNTIYHLCYYNTLTGEVVSYSLEWADWGYPNEYLES